MRPRDIDQTNQESDPLWYKDAIFYEVHVRAFYDSNGDGIGDFRGLVEKLDYIQDLGVTTIWVLPFYPSPLRDDGYDIADYTSVHPAYGVLRDVRLLVREAHKRGLKVVTELVLNHTSDEHPWFQRARRARPGSAWRDYYVWSDSADKYADARVIFKDYERSNWSWDPVANAYFWHRFYHHQPDLNFDNPRVLREVYRIIDFWLDMGIDGFRLDAIPYLIEREGTNCENLPETHAILKKIRAHVDQRYPGRMLLAEANQWPEDAVKYFGDGDECHMAFHFPLMPRMFMAIRMEDRFPIIDIASQTPAIPDSCQWALFLRNHDELTLEMVTDDERDYMYRVYAHDPKMRINLGIRRRLAPLLNNNRRRIELMNGLLFALPGTPVIYYGDEIGMGDNIYLGDRDGVRTPMQWSADRNAGFSEARRQQLYLPVIVDAEYHYEAVNVEAQQNNPHSLLWWMKRLIALRKRHRAFGRGTLQFLYPENRKVLAFVRAFEHERVLVIANLSRFVQAVELDLSAFEGCVPVEMFGRIEFPPVGEQPYFITLGPHAFFWFTLEPQAAPGDAIEAGAPGARIPTLPVAQTADELFAGRGLTRLTDVLPGYLRTRRWFGGKARRLKGVDAIDVIPLPDGDQGGHAILTRASYTDGDPDTYLFLLSAAAGERAAQLLAEHPESVLARAGARQGDDTPVVYDALLEPGLASALLRVISGRRRLRGTTGEVVGVPTRHLRALRRAGGDHLEPTPARSDQSNTSIMLGDQLILKLFRRLEPGLNPDIEITQHLNDRGFSQVPKLAGTLEYRGGADGSMSLAILQEFVANEGDAWHYTLDALGRYFEQALTQPVPAVDRTLTSATLLDLVDHEPPEEAHTLLERYLEDARVLGRRTAEMHLALADDAGKPDFTPEAMTSFYQRSLYQSMRTLTGQVFQSLRHRLNHLPEAARTEAAGILAREGDILDRFRGILAGKIEATRIRTHGDYHLGQVLFTGNDFVIIDFEGEPIRPLSERRRKRSPLADVAGMLRSFHYAVYSALIHSQTSGIIREPDVLSLAPFAQFWHRWVCATFLRAYLDVAGGQPFLPSDRAHLSLLLDLFRLEKAIYEVGYELSHRPDWVLIPLNGITHLIGPSLVAPE